MTMDKKIKRDVIMKRKAFRKFAENRTNKAISAINSIADLAEPHRLYPITDVDANRICQALIDAVEILRTDLYAAANGNNTFKL